MLKFNLEIAFATLIPDFIYQFMSSAQVKRDSLTCLELEDLGGSIKGAKEKEFAGMKQFLAMEGQVNGDGRNESKKDALATAEDLEQMSDRLDAELEEVDDDMYHRYTPGELKYIFGEIIDNIDRTYALFKEYTGINMAFSIGFTFMNGLESSLVIEFLQINDAPGPLEDVLLVPMRNYTVSDDILARAYFLYEKGKQTEYLRVFQDIAGMLQMKPEGHEQELYEGEGHRHGPGCGHMH